ncbi:MAG: tRNA (adenosine(37)-N6)-threonylcarbamoyltransferase complex dimerization subunit type 1 TsaB [Desulfobacterales bacterium]|nr:MAG: tRNA (adenosine(37)-N6)-threonylcarbamoyltransferase complex dimerization subunit type 1 TsaB [Desulfobacterales bacterium]
MKILAVDTATRSCSVAITDQDTLLAELTDNSGQTHSKHLLPMIKAAIRMAKVAPVDLEGLAVTVGPGSFTGLRIGISSVKGLALALDKTVVGISSLDALAWQSTPTPFVICAMLDARKGEVYCCRYRFDGGALVKETREQVLATAEVLRNIDEPCVFIGNGARYYAKTIMAQLGVLAHFALPGQNAIRASTVAYLSRARFENQDTVDIAQLVPHYIRKSDAELGFTPPMRSSRLPPA